MSKRVLIVSYYFAPQNAIGAVRPTKLAKFLTRMGYEVTVLCGAGVSPVEDPALRRDLQALEHVRVVVEPNLLRGRAPKPQANALATAPRPAASQAPGRLHAFKAALYRGYAYWTDHAFARLAIRELSKLGTFDAVVSSYGPHSSYIIGRYAKRKGYARRWVADFRDNVTMPYRWMSGGVARYLRRVQNDADAIAVASEGFLRMMGLRDAGCVITNGFDAEDLEGLTPAAPNDVLTLMYSGQLFGFERDLTPLFRCIRGSLDDGALPGVRLVYAGHDEASFTAQAAACGLKEQVVSYGYVDRGTALRLEQNADALLLALRNTQAVYGNLPGKLLEYLMLGKPILGCACGDRPHCDAAAVLRETGRGYCYEEAAPDPSALREALLTVARGAWPAPEPDKLAPYTHWEMAWRFAALIEGKDAQP